MKKIRQRVQGYVSLSVCASLMKYHRLSGLKQQKYSSHRSGSYKSKTRVPARLSSGETGDFSLHAYMVESNSQAQFSHPQNENLHFWYLIIPEFFHELFYSFEVWGKLLIMQKKPTAAPPLKKSPWHLVTWLYNYRMSCILFSCDKQY